MAFVNGLGLQLHAATCSVLTRLRPAIVSR
jgi:hypothetical protein